MTDDVFAIGFDANTLKIMTYDLDSVVWADPCFFDFEITPGVDRELGDRDSRGSLWIVSRGAGAEFWNFLLGGYVGRPGRDLWSRSWSLETVLEQQAGWT